MHPGGGRLCEAHPEDEGWDTRGSYNFLTRWSVQTITSSPILSAPPIPHPSLRLSMRIRSVHVRHFRSVENSQLTNCGGLNVLIGKNNAGKSNLLAAIELCLRHLRRGLTAVLQPPRRAVEQFTDRDTSKPFRIAVEFELPTEVSWNLRERLSKEAPHLDRSIEQIKTNNSVVFVISGDFGERD